jgi:hypothetical protein
LTADLYFACVLAGSGQVIGKQIRNHVSGVLPKALVSRIAISELTVDFPVITLFSAWRVTPRILAPSAIDNPSGSRQAVLMLRPAWGGLFMGMGIRSFSNLMVVDSTPSRAGPAPKLRI